MKNAKVAILVHSLFLAAIPSQAQWSTSGSNVYYNAGNVGVGTSSPGEKVEVVGGSIHVTDDATGIKFKADAQSPGFYQFTSRVDGVQHWKPDTLTSVDGIRFDAGGKTWAHLINTNKSTEHSIPQLYFTGYDGGDGGFEAPMFFNNTTHDGRNRAIALRLIDDSTTGTLQVTGLEINIQSPADRGGDSSGIYVRQWGDGNGISIYKSGQASGSAIEAGVLMPDTEHDAHTNPSNSIVSFAQRGAAFLGIMSGAPTDDTPPNPMGTGLWIAPASPNGNSDSRRAIRVTDSGNTSEKFYVQLDGNVHSAANVDAAYVNTVGSVAFAMKRLAWTCDFNSSGQVGVAHGISNGHKKVLHVSGFYKGGSGEMLPLSVWYIDGSDIAFTGGPASATGKKCRVAVTYSQDDDSNW